MRKRALKVDDDGRWGWRGEVPPRAARDDPGSEPGPLRGGVTAAARRHVQGDWGEVDQDDGRENDLSLKEGFRPLSAYTSKEGERLWIITEDDRSATTVLLPSEY